jgi:hypothetical protein
LRCFAGFLSHSSLSSPLSFYPSPSSPPPLSSPPFLSSPLPLSLVLSLSLQSSLPSSPLLLSVISLYLALHLTPLLALSFSFLQVYLSLALSLLPVSLSFFLCHPVFLIRLALILSHPRFILFSFSFISAASPPCSSPCVATFYYLVLPSPPSLSLSLVKSAEVFVFPCSCIRAVLSRRNGSHAFLPRAVPGSWSFVPGSCFLGLGVHWFLVLAFYSVSSGP